MTGADTEASSTLDRALALAAAGFNLFPVASTTKRPAVVGWQKLAARDRQQLEKWFADGRQFVGIFGGRFGDAGESLLILDCDDAAAVDYVELNIDLGMLPATRVHQTPSGGRHYFYRTAQAVGNSQAFRKDELALDVRGAGGLVVAAGRNAKGEYTVLADAPVAEAPPWLVERCGTAKPQERNAAPAVALDPASHEWGLSQAREYLTNDAPPAIEGSGGDQTTYQVACKLRDYGLSAAEAVELMAEHYNPRCEPPWSIEELHVKVGNAFAYAQNAPGSGNVAAKFDAVEQPAPRKRSVRRLRPLGEVLDSGPMIWDGLIPRGSIVAISAPPGRHKSNIATGLAFALATRAGSYLGRAVDAGDSLIAYIDIERAGTTEKRFGVLAADAGLDVADLPVVIGSPAGFRLDNPAAVKALIEELHEAAAEIGKPISLIVFDALGSSLSGLQLNDSGPATMAGAQLRRIRDSFEGCSVLVVAHNPKSGDNTVSGSQQFDAIWDLSMFVISNDQGLTGHLYVQKANDLALDEAARYVHWQQDVVRVEHAGRVHQVHRLLPSTASGAAAKPIKNALADRAYRTLCDVRTDDTPITNAEWRAECAEFLPKVDVGGKWDDAMRALIARGLIEKVDRGVHRRKTRNGPAVTPTGPVFDDEENAP